MRNSKYQIAVISVLGVLLSACGGDGGGDSSSSSSTNTTTATGVASKGPLSKARVTAYPVNAAGVVGTSKIAETVTDAAGNYSLALGNYVGCVDMLMTVTAETQMADEATGRPITPPSDYKLHAVTCVESASKANESVYAAITPFTNLAYTIATQKGGLSRANVDVANGFVFQLVGFAPVSTKPAPDGAGTETEKRYALFNAAISYLANTAPTTTDPVALKCFTDAGADQAKKIQCATNQLATSVGSDGSIKPEIVGLANALASASNGASNKTGLKFTPQDPLLRSLEDYDSKFANKETPPPLTPVDGSGRTDVDKAKAFFTALRSNANVLKDDPTSTGIVGGVKAFGDSLIDDVSLVGGAFGNSLADAQNAGSLWFKLKANLSTNTARGDCYLDSGTSIFNGGAQGGSSYQVATYQDIWSFNPSAATRVICDVYDSYGGGNYDQNTQVYTYSEYVRSFVYAFNGSQISNNSPIAYYSITRRIDHIPGDDSTNYIEQAFATNISPMHQGAVSFIQDGVDISGVTLVGDFSPGVDESSPPNLRADKYKVNVSGAFTPITGTTDMRRLEISVGQASLYKLGETTASTVVDVSAGSYAILPSKTAYLRAKDTFGAARGVVSDFVGTYAYGEAGGNFPSYGCTPISLTGEPGTNGPLEFLSVGADSSWSLCSVTFSTIDNNKFDLTYFMVSTDPAFGSPAPGCKKYYAGNVVIDGVNLTPTSEKFSGQVCANSSYDPNGSSDGRPNANQPYFVIGDLPKSYDYCYDYSCMTRGAAIRYSVSLPAKAGDFETVQVFTDWSTTTPEFTVGGKWNSVTGVASGSPTDVLIEGSKINLAASIRTAAGQLSGELLIDQLMPATDGSPLAGHAKLTGEASVVPVVNGVAGGSPVKFFQGALEVTYGSSPKNIVGFDGKLFIPGRPTLFLELAATEEPATKRVEFLAKYLQGNVDTTITGFQWPGNYEFTVADSSGVAVTVKKGVAKSEVTVGSRYTAELNTRDLRVLYKDGSFEVY